jgi:hypothetical protein
LGMAATLRTPHLEVGLETVHKTGKQGMFWDVTWRDLVRRLSWQGITNFGIFNS